MNFLDYFVEFLLCVGAIVAFCGLINSPKNTVVCASVFSGIAYIVYRIINIDTGREILAYFVASLVISVASEICARIFKTPSTILVFPAIIPLVPGVGLYRTMLCLVQGDLDSFSAVFSKTILISGIIAVTVAVVNAAARSLFHPHPPKR